MNETIAGKELPHDVDYFAQLMLDEQLTSDDRMQLMTLLNREASARRRFVGQVLLHSHLRHEFGKVVPPASLLEDASWSPDVLSLPEILDPSEMPFATADDAEMPELPNTWASPASTLVSPRPATTLVGRVGKGLSGAFSSPARIAVLAATVLLSVFGTFLLMRATELAIVARVENADDCIWSKLENGENVQAASDTENVLVGETVELTSGNLSLTLTNDVKTTVRGPARIRFVAPGLAKLDRGALWVNVPQQAIGFTVDTPAARIVDRGTEFTVEVVDQADTEVQVLQGRVEAAGRQSDGTFSSPLTLVAGEAARTDHRGDTQRIAFAPLEIHSDPSIAESSAARKRFAGSGAANLVTLAYYRLGENDNATHPGSTFPQVGNTPLHAERPVRYLTKGLSAGSNVAVSFPADANAYLQSAVPLPETADNWVLEAWVRPQSMKNAVIVFNGRPDGESFGLLLNDGKWAAALGADKFLIENEGSCVAAEWTHLALVMQQDKGAALWINAVRADVHAAEGLHVPDTELFCIGGRLPASEENFIGEVDEVRWSQLTEPFNPAMLLRSP